jgi:hemerythrin-like domain-containing protein
MSSPFHILKHEHRIIERGLRALDGVCARLEGGTNPTEGVPASTLLEIIEFMVEFADGYHHGKEETVLFPALERRGIPREDGPLGMMEYEHQVERELIGDLRLAASLYREGNSAAVNRFVECAHAYLRLLVGHIEKEDSVLFRLGDEILDDNDKDLVVERFKQADVDSGGRSLQEFEKVASDLEEKWAI